MDNIELNNRSKNTPKKREIYCPDCGGNEYNCYLSADNEWVFYECLEREFIWKLPMDEKTNEREGE